MMMGFSFIHYKHLYSASLSGATQRLLHEHWLCPYDYGLWEAFKPTEARLLDEFSKNAYLWTLSLWLEKQEYVLIVCVCRPTYDWYSSGWEATAWQSFLQQSLLNGCYRRQSDFLWSYGIACRVHWLVNCMEQLLSHSWMNGWMNGWMHE